MKVKIGLPRAYQVAKANGYTGAEALEAVRKWYAENSVRTENGDEVEVVTKTVTISVAADAGESVKVVDDSAPAEEPEAMPEMEAAEPAKSIGASELVKLREKARTLDALNGIAASGVNGVLARIHGPGQATAKNHRDISAKKAYNQKAARGDTLWSDADEVEAFNAWVRQVAHGWRPYAEKAADEQIVRKSGITTTFTSTGALVPPEWIQRLIDIRQTYGVAESLFYKQTMASDVATTPRRTGGLTVYTPGEAGAITASDPAYDQVGLVARKRATLSKVSSETFNDSAFSIGDLITKEIAWAFAKDDDNRAFNGDGTSTYAGDVGMRPYIKALSGTIANIAGLYVGTGNAYSELTMADFEGVLGRMPALENANGQPQWLVHPRFYHEVMVRLALAVGGVTAGEVEGKRAALFIGYPVKFANHMPRTEGNSQVCALFGHFDMAATFGRVRSMEVATSTDSDFANDLVAIRGTQRTAITVHDMGNAHATEASREPGPVVGLITAAS